MENEITIENKPDTSSASEQVDKITSDGKQPTSSPEELRSQRSILIGIIIGVLLLIGLIVGSVLLLASPRTDTARVRDIFIIFMALESLLIGLVLIILVIQLARLINLLQNEIKPIMDSTNETVSTLRGTATFLSDNMVEPVLKINEYLAGFRQLAKIFRAREKK
jgi:nitrate reductase gamma subunit